MLNISLKKVKSGESLGTEGIFSFSIYFPFFRRVAGMRIVLLVPQKYSFSRNTFHEFFSDKPKSVEILGTGGISCFSILLSSPGK